MTWVRLGLMLVLGLPTAASAAIPTVSASSPALGVLLWQEDTASTAVDTASPEAPTDSVESTKETAEEELTPAEIERRKNFLSVAWMMLIGVVVVCLLLLLIVLYIGSSVRRIARKPSPQAPLRDLFWYLKADSTTGSEPGDDTPKRGDRSEP